MGGLRWSESCFRWARTATSASWYSSAGLLHEAKRARRQRREADVGRRVRNCASRCIHDLID
jgi:hypothetical protein